MLSLVPGFDVTYYLSGIFRIKCGTGRQKFGHDVLYLRHPSSTCTSASIRHFSVNHSHHAEEAELPFITNRQYCPNSRALSCEVKLATGSLAVFSIHAMSFVMISHGPFLKAPRLAILVFCWALIVASGFVQMPTHAQFSATKHRIATQQWSLAAVTEQQVEEALVRSEEMWNKVLDLRKKADEAAEKAEGIRASLSQNSDAENGDKDGSKHDTAHLKPNTVSSLASLGDSMEADQYVKEAEELISEADSLEFKAKKALEETEKLLEQHLKDFPDSPLAQDDS